MDGLSVLTRVGDTIQTNNSTEVSPLFCRVLLGLLAGMETVVCSAAGDAAAAAAAATSEPDAFPTDIWDTPTTAVGMYSFYRILVHFIVGHC